MVKITDLRHPGIRRRRWNRNCYDQKSDILVQHQNYYLYRQRKLKISETTKDFNTPLDNEASS